MCPVEGKGNPIQCWTKARLSPVREQVSMPTSVIVRTAKKSTLRQSARKELTTQVLISARCWEDDLLYRAFESNIDLRSFCQKRNSQLCFRVVIGRAPSNQSNTCKNKQRQLRDTY